jgi:hypothetical protein
MAVKILQSGQSGYGKNEGILSTLAGPVFSFTGLVSRLRSLVDAVDLRIDAVAVVSRGAKAV